MEKMEGQFLKMPNGQEGNNFVRKGKGLSDEKFENLKGDWERREIRDGAGRSKEIIGKYEMKMNPRQREIIAFVVDEANEILDQYSERSARASMDLIRLVKDEFFEKIGNPQASGVCLTNLQIAVTRGNEDVSNTALADNAFHELMHLFSFQRTLLTGGDNKGYVDMKNERFGIGVYSKENQDYKYYKNINEAITVELGMRLWKKMHGNDLFKEDIWKLERKYGSNRNHTVLKMENDLDGSPDPKSIVHYPNEYKKTKATMQYIYEKNKDSFSSPEDVMELFIKAYFSGKLLPIARLIEKTYGKGSFRKIGEESA